MGSSELIAQRRKEKYPLDIPDLKTGLIYAEQDIKDRWKWYGDRAEVKAFIHHEGHEEARSFGSIRDTGHVLQ